MRNLVIVTLLLAGGSAQAYDYRGLFFNEECANEECSTFNADTLFVALDKGVYSIRVRKIRNNNNVCEFKGESKLIDGKLVATKKFEQWSNINHMMMSSVCRVVAVIEGEKAIIQTNGRCENWCDSGTLRTNEMYSIDSYGK